MTRWLTRSIAALIWAWPLAASAQAADISGSSTQPSTNPSVSRAVEMPPQHVLSRRSVRPRVVILRMTNAFEDESWPGAEQRLGAELRALGLEVTHATARAVGAEERMAELGAQAVAQRALASVRIVRHGGLNHIRVWLFDALTGKMLLRRVEMPVTGDRDGTATVALETVGLLHASLLELGLPGKNAARARAPSQVQRMLPDTVETSTKPRHFRFYGGPALVASVGEVGVAWGLTLGGAWRPRRWLSVVGEAFIPVVAAELDAGTLGRSQFSPWVLGAALSVEPWSGAVVSPALEIGVAALIVRAQGDAAPPREGRVDWTATAMPTVGMRGTVRVAPTLRLVGSVTVGLALPTLAVTFASEEVAHVGRPLMGATAGLAWDWGRP